MLSLSPAKLLVIVVVALIVLGPEKLPQVARQLGAAWHDLRQWRSRVESEVRGTFPNLPPVHEVAQAVRSPFAFLDRLADEHERTAGQASETADGPGPESGERAGGPGPPANGSTPPSANGSTSDKGASAGATASGNGTPARTGAGDGQAWRAGPDGRDDASSWLDDPSMN